MKTIFELEAHSTLLDPRYGMTAFSERVALTLPDADEKVFAVGRRNGLVVVEIEQDGNVYAHPLASVANHSPGLYNRLQTSRLDTLPAQTASK